MGCRIVELLCRASRVCRRRGQEGRPRPRISTRPCSFRPSALCTWPSNCRVYCASSTINTTTIYPCRYRLITGVVFVNQPVRRTCATANGITPLDDAEDADVACTQHMSASHTSWLRLPTFLCTSSSSRNRDTKHLDSDRNARARLEIPSTAECHSDSGLHAIQASSGDTPV